MHKTPKDKKSNVLGQLDFLTQNNNLGAQTLKILVHMGTGAPEGFGKLRAPE